MDSFGDWVCGASCLSPLIARKALRSSVRAVRTSSRALLVGVRACSPPREGGNQRRRGVCPGLIPPVWGFLLAGAPCDIEQHPRIREHVTQSLTAAKLCA